VVVAVGSRQEQDHMVLRFVAAARELKLGDGLDESATLCPVINRAARSRILEAIEQGVREGAKLVLDGRGATCPERPRGCFVGPTVFDHVTPDMSIGREEIFGPLVSVLRAANLDEAIRLCNRSRYGNSVSLFTQSGAAAREFRSRIQAGMLGINLGVPAPMAFFSFGGWKGSFFGDLGAHGQDAVDFYAQEGRQRALVRRRGAEGWMGLIGGAFPTRHSLTEHLQHPLGHQVHAGLVPVIAVVSEATPVLVVGIVLFRVVHESLAEVVEGNVLGLGDIAGHLGERFVLRVEPVLAVVALAHRGQREVAVATTRFSSFGGADDQDRSSLGMAHLWRAIRRG
jgi:hypothetical protein